MTKLILAQIHGFVQSRCPLQWVTNHIFSFHIQLMAQNSKTFLFCQNATQKFYGIHGNLNSNKSVKVLSKEIRKLSFSLYFFFITFGNFPFHFSFITFILLPFLFSITFLPHPCWGHSVPFLCCVCSLILSTLAC